MKRIDYDSMSDEAKELIRIATSGGGGEVRIYGTMRIDEDFDLQKTLGERPDLMPGLNEFVQWQVQQAELVEKTDSIKSVAHDTKKAADSSAKAIVSKTKPDGDEPKNK